MTKGNFAPYLWCSIKAANTEGNSESQDNEVNAMAPYLICLL